MPTGPTFPSPGSSSRCCAACSISHPPPAAAPHPAQASADAQAFAPFRALDGFGELADPSPDIQPIPAAQIDKAQVSAATPAGLYRRGLQERALNITRTGRCATPIAGLASGVTLRPLTPLPALALAPYAFALAMVLFLADCLAALFLGGGLNRLRQRRAAAAAALALLLLMPWHDPAHAQTADDYALQNALETRFAYVITGDAAIDEIERTGPEGPWRHPERAHLGVPGDPAGINIERDDIVFFPLLYWPVKPMRPFPRTQPLPAWTPS